MSSKHVIKVLLLAAVLLALILPATPAYSATTASKALRFEVVKRTTTHVVLEHGSVRLAVRSDSRFVSVHGVTRYHVTKRAATYYLLMPVISVLDYGAHADGTTDDVAHIQSAIAAAHGGTVYFPAGTYKLASTLAVPNGTTLVGESMTGAWLAGPVVYGSNSTFTDLKIGPQSAGFTGLHNVDGSNGSSFTRCHFRGGGGTTQINFPTVSIGDHADVSNLTFTDCEFERSLGTTWTGGNGNSENTISLYAQGNTVDGVTFNGCHFGVTNGVATGAQRMMVECWTAEGASNWWRNLSFTGCVFEVSRATGLDFACMGPGSRANPSGRGTYATVTGCTFKGSTDVGWGYSICSESCDHLTITNNTFYRCTAPSINLNNFGWPADNHATITGNTFDYDTVYEGIVTERAAILVMVNNANITGNTFTYSGLFPGWSGIVELDGSTEYTISGGDGNTVTGNTFNHNSGQTTLITQQVGASGNTITPNTVVYR